MEKKFHRKVGKIRGVKVLEVSQCYLGKMLGGANKVKKL